MVMKDAGENLYVEATTAGNLESTSIQRMTAVMNHPHLQQKDHHLSSFQVFLWSLLQVNVMVKGSFSSFNQTGQRCTGRNYAPGRRCCTPENPCEEGEGDCDGALDGGLNDGDKGCKGSLVCGSNNCKKFGSYYHQKDDCCEKPSNSCNTER